MTQHEQKDDDSKPVAWGSYADACSGWSHEDTPREKTASAVIAWMAGAILALLVIGGIALIVDSIPTKAQQYQGEFRHG